MSTRAFKLSFLPRNKQGSGNGLGELIGDVVGDIIPIIGDVARIFGEPDRPQLPQRGAIPGKGAGPNGGPIFRTDVTCVAPGISGGVPCCPSGFHFSQSTQCCVKNRRMNFQNGRAFNRAVRRIRGKARGDKRARQGITAAAKEMGCFPRSRSRSKPCK